VRGTGRRWVDGVGVLLLLARWATLDIATLRRRGRLASPGALTFTAIAALGGVGVIAWSVLSDHGSWWIVGAGVLAAIQLTAAVCVSLGPAGAA
jgi:hypothetical protein